MEEWQCRMCTVVYRAVSLRLNSGWRTFVSFVMGVHRLTDYSPMLERSVLCS